MVINENGMQQDIKILPIGDTEESSYKYIKEWSTDSIKSRLDKVAHLTSLMPYSYDRESFNGDYFASMRVLRERGEI